MNKAYNIFVLKLIIVTTAYGQLPSELAGVRSELETIYADDQTDRSTLSHLPPSSLEFKNLWKTINKKDSINLIKVQGILDKYGWLGVEEVGKHGNSALFLVIQHSDLSTQIKYLPLLEEATKAGKASASDLALLKDRTLVRAGKRQIYGSQIGKNNRTGLNYVLPLEDPENVDKRRAEVGLPPMRDYLKHFNMNWSILQYESDIAASRSQGAQQTKPLFTPFKPTHLRDSL